MAYQQVLSTIKNKKNIVQYIAVLALYYILPLNWLSSSFLMTLVMYSAPVCWVDGISAGPSTMKNHIDQYIAVLAFYYTCIFWRMNEHYS